MKLRSFFYVLLLLLFVNNILTAQEWTNNLPQKNDSELTFHDYQNAFNEYWDEFDVEGGYYFDIYGQKHKAAGWKQFKRWEWFWEQRVDRSTGEFPNFSAQDMVSMYYNPPQGLPGGLGVANWASLGPNASVGGYAGVGRLNCIAFHPSDNNTFWVGAAAGGIWKTTDGGSSWTVLNNGTGVLAVSDIVVPSDYATSNTLYIATGDKDHSDNRSIGVLKSTDGGLTWSATALSYTVSQGKMVTRLLLDPTNNQTIIAVTRDGVFKTTDGGTTWPLLSNPVYYFIDMEYKPGDFNTLYGATKNGGQIWRSVDGGVNWSKILDTGEQRTELAVTSNNSAYVYALMSGTGSGCYGVYRSTDSGASFTQVFDGTAANHNLLGWNSDGSGAGGQGWYDLSLAVNPSDKDMVFVGGVNTWKSTDGGSTFNISSHWYGAGGLPAVHADKHRLEYRSNGDLFECNDGGVYQTTDDGTIWLDKTNGMVISQMYRIGVSQTVPTETQCGLQDNGTKLITSGIWADVRGGDGMECLIDYTDVNTQYNTYTNGSINRTDNHWTSSVSIQPAGSSGAWVTPYVMDPVDHNTIYAGYQHVYKSTDKGASWSEIYSLNSANRFRALAVAPSNTQVIYASEPYHLWKTTNGGGAWTEITTGLPGNFITYIAVKYDDPNTLWVTLSTYGGNSIFESTNGGSSWTDISAGLPSVPVNTVVQNKLITDQVDLYVGTDNGVYYKAGAANWSHYSTGLPNVDVQELDVFYDNATPANSKLRAATFGRGLWETPIIAPCVLTITQSDEGTCNDGGTNMDASDDWFSITFNATQSSGGASDKYEVVLNANADGTGGTVLNAGGTTYGTAVIVGDAVTPPFAADGSTTYSITLRDFDDNTCHADYTTSAVASCSNAVATCGEIFMSEYIEGGSNNKCIELYNPTNAVIDLAAGNYQLKFYFNGSSSAGTTISLTGTVAAYDVYVVCDNNAGASFLAEADQTSTGSFYSGDDAVEFLKGGTTLDVLGQIGVDPGSSWSGGGCYTKDRTLVRKATIQSGDSNGGDTFDPSVEWDCFPKDTDTELGSHTSDCYVAPVCSLTIDQSDEGMCNDNNTGSDASDDWFDITFNASVSNGGATDKYEVVLNANADGTGGTVLNTGGTTYGTAVIVGDATTPPFEADGSTTYNITVRDFDDNTCHADYTTSTVASCSTPPPCSVTIDQSDESACNNNNSNNDASDDWFDITFNASVSNGGATDKYEVVLNANTDGTGGTVLNTGGTTYGTSVVVGDATTPPFEADGTTIYNITVRDIDDPTCHADYNTSTVSSCSTGSITMDNSGGPTIADPCTCAGNGVFDEEVVIHSAPGEVWTLTANVDYLDPTTMLPFALGTVFNEVSPGTYTLVGKHLDDEGYSVESESVSHAGITLSISNECWYPSAQIDNLPSTICPTGAPITLMGSAQLGNSAGSATAETETWSGPGVAGGVFTPAVAGLGLHTITYTFDATDDNPDEHHPGCSDIAVQQIFVGDVTPPMFENQLACEIINCGDPMPVNLPDATDNCDVAVTVTEEPSETVTDYSCTGEFLVYGVQDQPFIPYSLNGYAPLATQFVLDLNNLNGIGAYCDAESGKHIYGLWQDPTNKPSLTNSPDVYFVDVNPYTGKSAVLGTISAPSYLTPGANETAISFALNGLGDVGGTDFYMAGIALLFDNNTNSITDFKLYKGTIGITTCPPMGGSIPVVYDEIILDPSGAALLANFANNLSAFLNGTGGEPSGGIQDWAVSVDQSTLYAFMGIENALMAIDIATNAETTIIGPASNIVNGYTGSTGAATDEFAGMYYDDGGTLHGYQSDRGRIFSIDVATGELTLVDDGLPIDQRGDAASCTDCSVTPISCPLTAVTKRVFKVEDAFGNVNYQYQLITTIDNTPPMFDVQLACDTIGCGDALPTDLPTATDKCDGTITVTEETSEIITDYTCTGDFLIFGMQDQPFLPYGLYGHSPLSPQFVLDLNNVNGIGTHCDTLSGKHIYGLWQNPVDVPSLTNSPDVYFVDINPNTGKTAVMGTIAAPPLLTPGTDEVAISYPMNGIGDAGENDFYMAGVSLLYNTTTNTITDFKLYMGTIGITVCPPIGSTVDVTYQEINLDAACTAFLSNFAANLNAFLNGAGGEPSGGIQDWALTEDGATLYAFMGIENALMAIDVATVAAVCTPADPVNVTNGFVGSTGATTDEFAGMYFDAANVLHGFQSDRGRIFSIAIPSGTLTLVDDALPIDQRGDAASCFDCQVTSDECPMISKTKRVFKAEDACGNVNYQYQIVYEIDETEVSINDPADECENGADMLFTGVPTDANGVFTTTAAAGLTDNGDGTAVLDVSVAGAGTYKVYYTYNKNGTCCPKTDSVEVIVLETPDVPDVSDITVCEGGSTNIVPVQSGGGGAATCGINGPVAISGILDGTISGGTPKFVELYVYTDTDFSGWSLINHNNGSTGNSNTTNLSALGTINAGEYVYVIRTSDVDEFQTWFGLSAAQYAALNTITGSAPNVNGDDAVTLEDGSGVVDTYGAVGTDGTTQSWEYTNGWAYRNNETGPNGTTFDDTEWTFSGVNALNGAGGTNGGNGTPAFPIGTYVCTAASGSLIFNFYTDAALTNQVATEVASYDPMTTVANSPQSIWVTGINTTTGCESDAVEVVITVYAQPTADAGDNQFFCDLPASVSINAIANYAGIWSTSGAGVIGNTTNTSTTYAPDGADMSSSVIMTWTTSSPVGADGCEDAVDSMAITIVPPTEDAEFSYGQDEYCPDDANPTVTHIAGIDGIYTYTVVSAGTNLVIDKHTGEIDMATSDWGTYDVTNTVDGRGNLVITGVIDGPITGGLPKAIEVYAIKDISDLSRYGLESANNNNASSGVPEFTFPDDAVAAGTYIWIATETTQFNAFFGVDPTYTDGVSNINGNDAILLYNDGQVIDVFGEVGTNNNIGDWNYQDGWAYRNNNSGPDGTLFDVDNWYFSGPGALVGATSNGTAATPFPMASFSTNFTGSCDATTHTERVVVGDLIPPVINCPADMNVFLDAGECSIFLWYDDPDVTDNCDPNPNIVKVSGPDKGSEFTLLGTPYTVVFEVTDKYGNGPVTCSFDIAIHGFPKPVDETLACNDVVNVSLNENCEINMNADNFLEGGPYQCYNMFEVYVDDDATNVSNLDIHLDPGTYMVTVKDNVEGGNACMTTMIVSDKIVPQFECNCPEGGEFPQGSEWVGAIEGEFSGLDKTYNNHQGCYNFGTMEVLPDDGAHYFDIYPIEVSVDGGYDIIVSDDNGKSIVAVYKTYFNSAEVCNNLQEGAGGYFNVFGSFYAEPNTTITLEAGEQYYIVVSDFDELYEGNYKVEIVPPVDAHIYFTEGVYSNECTLWGCFDSGVDYTNNFTVPVAIDNCSVEIELVSSDFVEAGTCGLQKIVNVWKATDLGGNEVTCTQEYVFQGIDLAKIEWPKNFDDLPFNKPMLECNTGYPLDNLGNPNPYKVGGLEGTGYPSGFSNACGEIEMFYTDQVYTEADGVPCGTKIIRSWVIVNDCTGAVYSHKQIIRITDKTSPEFMVNENILVNAKGYICNANVEVPTIMHLKDNCCATPIWWVTTDLNFEISGDINGNNLVDVNETWTVLNVPIGTYTMCYHAMDCCGNEVEHCITITVEDNTPPIAICEQFKQVSLTTMGNSKVYAENFSSGSFDNCKLSYFKVLRVNDDLEYDGGCQELNGDDKLSTPRYLDDNGNWKNNDVWYDDEVFYCCEDAGKDIMTSLRVYDVNPGDGPVNPKREGQGGDLFGHYNDCWAMVHVECKIPPSLSCPPVVVNCEESLDPDENPSILPEVTSVCGYELEYSDKRDLGVCGAKITRTWNATGCGKTVKCKQKITVVGTDDFDPCTIKFPKDVQADCSKELKDGKEPIWDEYPCNVVTAEVIHEDTFRFVDGACYKIVREWAVIDWCVYEANTGAEDNVDVISGTKLNCASLVTDGYYRYTQVLMVTDFIPPTIEVEEACIGYTDGCFAKEFTLNATASDSCNVEQKFNWKYIVTNMDTWETVQYSYNYTPVPDTGRKGKRSKDNIDRTKQASLLILDEVPGGNYRVTWTVGDGCGNATSAYQYFSVVDKKAPTPILVNLSTAFMSNCMVEVCAKQFDKGGCDGNCISSFDNCTVKEDLYFTFSEVLPQLDFNPLKWKKQLAKYGRYFYDPTSGLISTEDKYLFGEAFAWDPIGKTSCRVFGEDRDGIAPLKIQYFNVYVWDQFALNGDCDDNNYDFGAIVLSLNNDDDCKEGGSLVQGMVSSCSNDTPISDVKISFDNGENTQVISNNDDGQFETTLGDDDYKVTASKRTDGLNGITTLDIVMIQKHLLGIDKVSDVCQYVAMDANGDGKVSASDILNIRKRILGTNPAVVDWHFMDENYLNNNSNPSHFNIKESYKKSISVVNGNTNDNSNFVGIYPGDINLSSTILEDRSSTNIDFKLDDVVLKRNEILEIPVYSDKLDKVAGLQFTMNLTGMEVTGVNSGLININNYNYNVSGNNLVVSWNNTKTVSINENDVLFTIVVKSNIDGKLVDAISINDNIAKSEIYSGSDLIINNIKLSFRNIDNEYMLYQNEPNPFSEKTIIGFDLPNSDSYTLKIFSVTGKLVKEFTNDGNAGRNTIEISKKDLGSANVLYYRLESGDFIDTKKMIILK